MNPKIQTKCRCGTPKTRWHLVCRDCWRKIPEYLRDEVFAAYKEEQCSPRHMKAMRQCIDHLRALETKNPAPGTTNHEATP